MQTITKPQVLAQPFCNSGDKNVIPNSATGSNLASLQEGFPEITGKPLKNGGIPPERKDFNGLLNMDSQFYFAFQNGWRPTFDADVSNAIGGYALGAILWCDSGNYFVKSLKANNTDNFVTDPSKIDGVSWQILTAGEFRLPLLSFAWYDHQLNDQSFVRADNFSWLPGVTYTSAYQHLVDDIQGKTSQTETIGGYTITYYQANDGHKIVLADQETTAQNIYNESGVAWYYILDTANIRFKLPRTKYGFTGLRDMAGKYVPESLPNHDHITHAKGTFSGSYFSNNNQAFSGGGGSYFGGSSSPDSKIRTGNASESNSAYQDNAPVQQRATQMYLYFYVGNFSQSATEQTAGLNSELFNGKVDLDGSNATFPHIVETYSSGTDWYRVWSDGWCEQGGIVVNIRPNTFVLVTLLKPFANTNYSVIGSGINAEIGTYVDEAFSYRPPLQTTGFYGGIRYWTDGNVYATRGFSWEAKGYIS